MNYLFLAEAILFVPMILVVLFVFGAWIGKRNPVYLRGFLYCFSFSAWLTFSTLFCASWVGIFDKNGSPVGPCGQLILNCLTACLDLNKEFGAVLFISFLIFMPQCITYGLSGLYGYARNGLRLQKILFFLFFILMKSLMSFSGIVIVFIPFCSWKKWINYSILKTVEMTEFSSLFILYAFVISLAVLNKDKIIKGVLDILPSQMRSFFCEIHRLSIRHQADELRITEYAAGDFIRKPHEKT